MQTEQTQLLNFNIHLLLHSCGGGGSINNNDAVNGSEHGDITKRKEPSDHVPPPPAATSLMSHRFVTVRRGSPAARSGQIQPGDQLEAVEGRAVGGLQHRDLAQILRRAGNTLRLSITPRHRTHAQIYTLMYTLLYSQYGYEHVNLMKGLSPLLVSFPLLFLSSSARLLSLSPPFISLPLLSLSPCLLPSPCPLVSSHYLLTSPPLVPFLHLLTSRCPLVSSPLLVPLSPHLVSSPLLSSDSSPLSEGADLDIDGRMIKGSRRRSKVSLAPHSLTAGVPVHTIAVVSDVI